MGTCRASLLPSLLPGVCVHVVHVSLLTLALCPVSICVAVLRADSDRLQPSHQRDVVLVHYSASRMHTIALLLCIRG